MRGRSGRVHPAGASSVNPGSGASGSSSVRAIRARFGRRGSSSTRSPDHEASTFVERRGK